MLPVILCVRGRADVPLAALEDMWDAVVFALVGNTLVGGEYITGARVIDKVRRVEARGGSIL